MSQKKSNNKQIKINVSIEDYEKIKHNAIEDEVSMAEYIRQQLNIEFTAKRQRNLNIEHKQIIFHLLKIGTNINQIAKALNQLIALDRQTNESSSDIDRKLYEDIHLIKMYLYQLSTILL